LEYTGTFYHVMSRGVHQEAIFLDDEDRGRFLKTLGEGFDDAQRESDVKALDDLTGRLERTQNHQR
jgi:hypothetical protein